MGTLLLLTGALQPSAEVLPALALLGHTVKILPAEGSALLEAPDSDLVLVDGRQELAHARDLCRLIRTTGSDVPVLMIITEGGLAVVAHDWAMDDVVLHTCGPAELEARIRLAIGRLAAEREAADPASHVIRSGEVVVDDATYTAKISGRALDLTYKEFELLKYLAQHPGRVFTRQQLLQEVWGYDYFGGTRTVDVHVRRLRAKLGPENEHLIGTVRNVGYRFVLPSKEQAGRGRLSEARRPAPTPDTQTRAAQTGSRSAAVSCASRPSRRQSRSPESSTNGRRLDRCRMTDRQHAVDDAVRRKVGRPQLLDHQRTTLTGDRRSAPPASRGPRPTDRAPSVSRANKRGRVGQINVERAGHVRP